MDIWCYFRSSLLFSHQMHKTLNFKKLIKELKLFQTTLEWAKGKILNQNVYKMHKNNIASPKLRTIIAMGIIRIQEFETVSLPLLLNY